MDASPQLQPLVFPQDGQAWHDPARCIFTPHCMQYGASGFDGDGAARPPGEDVLAPLVL